MKIKSSNIHLLDRDKAWIVCVLTSVWPDFFLHSYSFQTGSCHVTQNSFEFAVFLCVGIRVTYHCAWILDLSIIITPHSTLVTISSEDFCNKLKEEERKSCRNWAKQSPFVPSHQSLSKLMTELLGSVEAHSKTCVRTQSYSLNLGT